MFIFGSFSKASIKFTLFSHISLFFFFQKYHIKNVKNKAYRLFLAITWKHTGDGKNSRITFPLILRTLTTLMTSKQKQNNLWRNYIKILKKSKRTKRYRRKNGGFGGKKKCKEKASMLQGINYLFYNQQMKKSRQNNIRIFNLKEGGNV